MKVSLNWAQQYSNVDLTQISTEEIVDKIGRQLGEVEGVEYWGPRYDGVVVAKIVSCKKHSNADKLQVCRVDDGGATTGVDRGEDGFVQVVCGAPNARAGLTVAWLPPGVTVPSSIDKDPFVLEARAIRGEISNGMLASPHELGISDNHDGILEIDSEDVGEEPTTPGTPFKKLYNLNDAVVEIENKMFTHRPDCFGILGVARELAGIQQKSFQSPEWYVHSKETATGNQLPLRVAVESPELVPRFMAVALQNVTVAPSPIWLQAGLTRVGIRPINNIVDITNFVMHLTGQPLHAYDYDKVADRSHEQPTLVARKARDGDTLTLLNGKTITPQSPTVVIATDQEVIGIGGVMGGADTEVDAQTKNIIVECATFDMYNIRRTSMKYGLFTDAVTRFNKGQSPLQNDRVIGYTLDLLQQIVGTTVASAMQDLHGQLPEPAHVTVSTDFINLRLGTNLSSSEVAELLRNVEFEVSEGEELEVTAPFWRTDIAIPEDIVEEVGRLYGYDNIPMALPRRSASPSPKDERFVFKSKLRDILSAAGANEVLTYSFVHGKLLEKTGQPLEQAYGLSNALSPDLQYYRLSLTPSLLEKVQPNLKAGFEIFALYEMNKAHSKQNGLDELKVPEEIEAVSLVFAANDKQAKQYSGAAYYQARKYVDELGAKLGLTFVYEPITEPLNYPVAQPFDPTRSALVREADSGDMIGIVGDYTSEVQRNCKLPNFAAGFELGTDHLLACVKNAKTYQPVSRFPWTSQDISFKVSTSTSYATLAAVVAEQLNESRDRKGYDTTFSALDIYQPTDQSGAKHITFTITLSHPERTLVTEEVNQLLDGIAEATKAKLSAERL